MTAATVEGIVNFSNLTSHDVFNGQDTGQYSMTITMAEDDAASLSAMGVKIKDYQGNKQRKFNLSTTLKPLMRKVMLTPVRFLTTHGYVLSTSLGQHIQYMVCQPTLKQ